MPPVKRGNRFLSYDLNRQVHRKLATSHTHQLNKARRLSSNMCMTACICDKNRGKAFLVCPNTMYKMKPRVERRVAAPTTNGSWKQGSFNASYFCTQTRNESVLRVQHYVNHVQAYFWVERPRCSTNHKWKLKPRVFQCIILSYINKKQKGP
jgi:hypothetical protein